MPLLPRAHAATLLSRDAAGRMLFFPAGDENSGYLIPDAQAEQRIFRELRRIRFAQLAAWALLPIACIAVLAATDGKLPEWLFLSVLVAAAIAIQFAPDWARQRLAHGLDRASEQPVKPSILDKLPLWAIISMIVLAVGVAVYFGGNWPLKALSWIDEFGLEIMGSKALAKIAVVTGGAVAVLWGAVTAVRRWFRP